MILDCSHHASSPYCALRPQRCAGIWLFQAGFLCCHKRCKFPNDFNRSPVLLCFYLQIPVGPGCTSWPCGGCIVPLPRRRHGVPGAGDGAGRSGCLAAPPRLMRGKWCRSSYCITCVLFVRSFVPGTVRVLSMRCASGQVGTNVAQGVFAVFISMCAACAQLTRFVLDSQKLAVYCPI